jgi:glyoxylase-like metal-dependent hydrolase (beta-lactamase superfamily II)
MRFRLARNLLLAVLLFPALCTGKAPNRVTILYDAFGKSAPMTKAWGFSALVEFGGKRILFDTGGNAEILEHNVKALGVDLSQLDFVVISHRHDDHISGLNYLLRVNPTVKIYTSADPWGPFGWAAPKSLYREDDSLAANMRYFDAGHFSGANHLAGHWHARTSRNFARHSRPARSYHCGWMFSRGRGEDSRSCDQNRSARPGSIWRPPSCGSA